MKLYLILVIIAALAYETYARHCIMDDECATWSGCYCDKTFHMCVCPQAGWSRGPV